MAGVIQAISFDLWDTLVVDDSDELERQARGMLSKKAERRFLTWQALSRHGALTLEQVSLAYDVADAAFNKVWHDQHVTWPIGERLLVLQRGLGRVLNAEEQQELVSAHARMEVDIPPRPVAGVHEALAELKRKYRLAVVSDAVVTPGAQLRQLLAGHGLDQYFSAFVFSDEVGRSKPHRRMFEAAATALGVSPAAMVHVGDRQHNDVAGAQALGMRAVLFVAARAVDRDGSTADVVCEHYRDLPGSIAVLERRAAG